MSLTAIFRLAHKFQLCLGFGILAHLQVLAHLPDLGNQLFRRTRLGGDQLFHKRLIAKQPLVGKSGNLALFPGRELTPRVTEDL